jgi:CHAT domain-containing protein
LRELRQAIPRVLDMIHGERSSSESGVLRTARINWMLDGYIALLSEFARDANNPGAAEAMDEAFRMADLARGSSVQRALAASASRLNISDPALADLARREQDLEHELAALSSALANLLARGRLAEQDQVVADMRASLARLRAEHARAQAELARRFPDYAALLDPRPVGIESLRKLLKPGEALLSVHLGVDRTAVWAIPAQGPARFAVTPLGAAQVEAKVSALRKALDPADPLGRLPPFPYAAAQELYAALLAPVEEGLRDVRELIVIPQGRLGQLPFGVLLTAPFTTAPAKPDFAEMAQAPWLIKRFAISQLPSALALSVLRGQGKGPAPERAFIGFGDPVFTRGSGAPAGTRGLYARRNLPDVLRQAAPEAAGTAPAQPVNFTLLPALPDTAQEIAEVAGVLSADRTRDVFLQGRASEARLKKTDLSPYRVVMFATHGLMSGEMPGLYQPALALSNPALTGDGEDGLLTMEEILALKLRADWVVLSACNTAAAGDANGESVSGLGRAFFYAGAKSLLVTNWAVETESARMLTTELFRQQAANPALTRAGALRQSMLALMQKSRPEFSYAHPMFWAPYSIVGDGG